MDELQQEPSIAINGIQLSPAQAMTVRVAIGSFAISLQSGLGDDAQGKKMVELYLARISELNSLMRG